MKLSEPSGRVAPTCAGFTWRQAAAVFVAGAVAGAIGWYWLGPVRVVTEKEPVAESTLVHTTLAGKKEIVYVEKEPGEKTDVRVDAAKPQVTVSVNGQPYKVDVLSGERQKFEKGKLVITEETQLKLEIKTPPQPRLSLGVGWGRHGPALIAGGKVGNGGGGWWAYGDRKTLAGGLMAPLGR